MEKYCPRCRQKRNSRSNFCDICGTTLEEREGRIKLPYGMKEKIFRRDGYRCRMCGASRDNGIELTIDHIIPIADGGTNDIDNLQTLCRECNENKSDLNFPSGLEIDIETKENELKLLNDLLTQEESKLSNDMNDDEKIDALFKIKQLKEKHIPPIEAELKELREKHAIEQKNLRIKQQKKERQEKLFKKLYVNLSETELSLLNDYLDKNYKSDEDMLKEVSKNYSENEIYNMINFKREELCKKIDVTLTNKTMFLIKSEFSLEDSRKSIINYLIDNYSENEIFSMIKSCDKELFVKYSSSLNNKEITLLRKNFSLFNLSDDELIIHLIKEDYSIDELKNIAVNSKNDVFNEFYNKSNDKEKYLICYGFDNSKSKFIDYLIDINFSTNKLNKELIQIKKDVISELNETLTNEQKFLLKKYYSMKNASDKELIIYLVDNCLTKDKIINISMGYRGIVWDELNKYLPTPYEILICKKLSLPHYNRRELLTYLIGNGYYIDEVKELIKNDLFKEFNLILVNNDKDILMYYFKIKKNLFTYLMDNDYTRELVLITVKKARTQLSNELFENLDFENVYKFSQEFGVQRSKLQLITYIVQECKIYQINQVLKAIKTK